MKTIENILIIAVIIGSLFLGGCFTDDIFVGEERPPQMNNTPFTNFVPANTSR